MISDAVILALITGVPTTLAAVGALWVSIKNSHKSDVIIEKAVEIHTLTNSNLSRVTGALEVANAKIDGLQKQVALMVGAKLAAEDAKAVADKAIQDAGTK